jgi:hypothetical protein
VLPVALSEKWRIIGGNTDQVQEKYRYRAIAVSLLYVPYQNDAAPAHKANTALKRTANLFVRDSLSME